MDYERIEKPRDWPGKEGAARPNLIDYEAERSRFDWAPYAKELSRGGDGTSFNLAHAALDRHIENGDGDRLALRWLDKDAAAHDFSYAELNGQAARFASAIEKIGIGTGERVYSLLGRVPELYFTILGTWKRGAVYCPLFSAFGPEPVLARLSIGEATAIVTTPTFYKRKVAPIRDQVPTLKYVLLVGDNVEENEADGLYDFRKLLAAADDRYETAATSGEDLSTLHFTSGTTGKPKGAMHVHGAVVTHYVTGRFALDLHEGDMFWCTADPGWVTGTSYGVIAPLVCGATLISDSEEFEAERWYRILEENKVAIWYTAPTAVRMMMKAGAEVAQKYDHSSLRFISSVGEPLNPEGVIWGVEAFGLPFHDNWWQTETGGIMIANYASMDIKPGSMGKPLPGVEAAIVKIENGGVAVIEEPDEEGELALKPGWPSQFRGYLHNEERYKKAFAGGWYLSGDLAKRDAEGYYWFVGRADDVIKSAGHLIGPFEVESALMEHEAVAEAGVIGVPDPVAMEVVKAFVALKPGYEASEELRKSLMAHARKRLGPAVAPREIAFADGLPKTRSGKIMRRLLKARELGLPEGDTSTLENNSGAQKSA